MGVFRGDAGHCSSNQKGRPPDRSDLSDHSHERIPDTIVQLFPVRHSCFDHRGWTARCLRLSRSHRVRRARAQSLAARQGCLETGFSKCALNNAREPGIHWKNGGQQCRPYSTSSQTAANTGEIHGHHDGTTESPKEQRNHQPSAASHHPAFTRVLASHHRQPAPQCDGTRDGQAISGSDQRPRER